MKTLQCLLLISLVFMGRSELLAQTVVKAELHGGAVVNRAGGIWSAATADVTYNVYLDRIDRPVSAGRAGPLRGRGALAESEADNCRTRHSRSGARHAFQTRFNGVRSVNQSRAGIAAADLNSGACRNDVVRDEVARESIKRRSTAASARRASSARSGC